jgi:hypothetical protein
MTPKTPGGNTFFTGSSNTTLWDGPQIDCLKLCKGDTVTDVQYKAALLICTLQQQLDLSDLDVKSLFSSCAQCPDPEKELGVILQALINKVYELEKKKAGAGVATEPILTITTCLREADANGDTPTEEKHSLYTARIGRKLCSALASLSNMQSMVSSLANDVTGLDTRVSSLESAADQITPIKIRVGKLEVYKQELEDVLGSNNELAMILSEECQGNGPNGEVVGLSDGAAIYMGNSGSAAESIKKLWQLVCDLRSAVKVMQDNCCKITCDDIFIDFDVKFVGGDRTKLQLFFAVKSSIPNGFTDVKPIGNQLTITDGLGSVYVTYIKLAEAVQDVDGILVDLELTALDPTTKLTFEMDAALKSDNLTCVKCVTKEISAGGPTCDFCEISVVGGATGADGHIVVTFETLPSN